MIIIHARLKVKPEQENALLEAVKLLIPLSRAEDGNISYDLLKDTEKDHHFTMVELWENLEAVQAHNTSEHFTSFVQKAQFFMAEPMDLKIFSGDPVNVINK